MDNFRRRLFFSLDSSAVEYVDLGLPSGIKWAPGNICKDNEGNYYIGAPTDQGCYFSWGNVKGYNKGGYSFATTVYMSTPGYHLSADIPATEYYDAARATLGGNWRLPTKDECQELIDNCTCTWTTQDGVAGMRFTSKKSGYTGNSIFIPASGLYYDYSTSGVGSNGYYWSSTRYQSDYAWYLNFRSGYQSMNYVNRFYGTPVRAVL